MRIVGIILAAGEGRRIGGPKALLSLGERSFLCRVAELLAREGVDHLLAVLGYQAERVRQECGVTNVEFVTNTDYARGMLGSTLCGLDRAQALGADAVLVHPVDHPVVSPATVAAVVAALRAEARVAVPSWEGRRGHPAGFARGSWSALRCAPPSVGARAVLRNHPNWVVHVPGDSGCLTGINTPEEYERLSRQCQPWGD
jgi:molybdenum cofactor cytidylyltransferase